MVADTAEVHMVADTEVGKVADKVAGKVADMVAGHGCLVNWAQTFPTPTLPDLRVF